MKEISMPLQEAQSHHITQDEQDFLSDADFLIEEIDKIHEAETQKNKNGVMKGRWGAYWEHCERRDYREKHGVELPISQEVEMTEEESYPIL